MAGAPMAASWFADRQMGPALIAYGTPAQQARHLPPMLAGESTWCIGMSEPDSGSDLASLIDPGGVRDGDEWVIDGRKVWTCFAHHADHCYLICRTAAVAGRPHLGISEIIVPMDSPGIEMQPHHRPHRRPPLQRGRGSRGCACPVGNLVGVEGAAFAQTMRQLEHERGGIDRLVSNRALLRWALDRADRDDPLVRQEVARLETGYRLGRLLVVRGALGQAPTGFSAATKCVCTEYEQRVAGFVAHVAGRTGDAVGRPRRRARLRPGLHDHGGHLERDAQHRRRAHPGPAPMSDGAREDAMIELDVPDRVATLTLADPDRRNTISSALNAALIEALDELEGSVRRRRGRGDRGGQGVLRRRRPRRPGRLPRRGDPAGDLLRLPAPGGVTAAHRRRGERRRRRAPGSTWPWRAT